MGSRAVGTVEKKIFASAAVPAARVIEPVARSTAEYLRAIASMSPAEVAAEIDNPCTLLMDTHVHKLKRLDIAYAPFDHVNTRADIVIVGITPGKQQMREAIDEARRAMRLGLSDGETLARAKVHASFAGPMRVNLVKLMDAVRLNHLLGIASTASLWEGDCHRAHFTSAIRYPTFVDGENYSRSPDLNGVPFLSDRSVKWLKEELSLFTNAVIVPMGDMVSEVLTHVGREMAISNDRILSGCLMQAGLTMDRFPNSSELPGKMTNGAVASLASQLKSEASKADWEVRFSQRLWRRHSAHHRRSWPPRRPGPS